MIRSIVLGTLLTLPCLAQDPFTPMDMKPMDMNAPAAAAPSAASARDTWIASTNKSLELKGKTYRVKSEDLGATVVLVVRDVEKKSQAKPILKGKGEYAALVKEAAGVGFTRLVVRNLDGQQWGATLRMGQKPVLEN